MMIKCPCCSECNPSLLYDSTEYYQCRSCEHVWKTGTSEDYTSKQFRNSFSQDSKNRKYQDRLNDVLPLIEDGKRILEIGCAEGELGAIIKKEKNVHYTGVELSEDYKAASLILDVVHRKTARSIADDNFDYILSFHVLEHIQDLESELTTWKNILLGLLILEVPNRSGHPYLEFDKNVEHYHQFTTCSIVNLLTKCGFEIVRLSTGHFESAGYSDSIRVVAKVGLTKSEMKTKMISAFKSTLPGSFNIWGCGGDFLNYILPYLNELSVNKIFDSNPLALGKKFENLQVSSFDQNEDSESKILIASLKFKTEIHQHLLNFGIDKNNIVGIDEVLEMK